LKLFKINTYFGNLLLKTNNLIPWRGWKHLFPIPEADAMPSRHQGNAFSILINPIFQIWPHPGKVLPGEDQLYVHPSGCPGHPEDALLQIQSS
jgi:hypothetical protein